MHHVEREGGNRMYDGGAFGGYTRWAVVFLIIFVLFILLVPYWGGGVAAQLALIKKPLGRETLQGGASFHFPGAPSGPKSCGSDGVFRISLPGLSPENIPPPDVVVLVAFSAVLGTSF